MHQRRVGDDAIEPRAEPRLMPERGEVAIHGQKPLLHDVRRIVVTDQAAGETIDAGLVADRDLVERMVVPEGGA